MKPIINPFWIYLAEVTNNIKFITGFLLVGLVIAYIVLWLSYAFDSGSPWCNDKKEQLAENKKTRKIILISAIATSVIVAIAPSKDTIYKMIVASNITEDNLKSAGQTIDNLVDSVIDKINKLTEENKGE